SRVGFWNGSTRSIQASRSTERHHFSTGLRLLGDVKIGLERSYFLWAANGQCVHEPKSMLRLSKKADYALIAMKHLTLRGEQASSSAREIAEQYDIPIELMAKVLQRLVQRGLLASHQGTRGGYQLARLPRQITVADVIQAIDGPVTVTACSSDDGQC